MPGDSCVDNARSAPRAVLTIINSSVSDFMGSLKKNQTGNFLDGGKDSHGFCY